MLSFESENERVAFGDWKMQAQRPTWAEINLEALAANFRAVRRIVGPGVNILSVVKAEAYGHGAVVCARRLAAEGSDWFGVALPEEGINLRLSDIRNPILCLGGFWEGQAALCIKYGLVPVVYRLDMAEAIDRAARDAGVVADVHVKVDTGMGRLGVRYDEAAEFADALRRFKNVRVDGLMTHFAAADDPALREFTDTQRGRYLAAVETFRGRGHSLTYEDMANSAATYSLPETRRNMVRAGAILYGMWRDVLLPTPGPPPLRPVMTLCSHICLLKRVPAGETLGYSCSYRVERETLVATLPVGYKDGFQRGLSNCGRVIVRGCYAPVVGRVSMDLTLVDVTDVPGVALNDRVTLIGQDGPLAVSAEEFALRAGTISYDVLCAVSERVPRVYITAQSHPDVVSTFVC